MTLANLVIGSPEWWPAALAVLAVGLVAIWLSYRGLGAATDASRAVGIGLKVAGVALLAFCLVEPLWSGTRARPGENLFLVLVDDSRSERSRDDGSNETRGDAVRRELTREGEGWRTRLEQDFDVRGYTFGEDVQRVSSFEELAFEGRASRLHTALDGLRDRHRGRPVAGVLLFTDGNATDVPSGGFDTEGLPPIHPVVVGRSRGLVDVAISQVAVTETSFEDAPITVRVDATTLGVEAGERLVARLLDPDGEVVEERAEAVGEEGEVVTFRFEVRYVQPGVRFFTAQVALADEVDEEAPEGEATYANNRRLVRVHRRAEPRRILYVAGRPNWEFKFLNRAIEEDEQLQLVGLLRIANREPKFDWRGRDDESSNPLFRGFDKEADAGTERFDEAVTKPLNVTGPDELPGGRFPKDAEGLFRYDALVLDDVERAFFTADQLDLVERFVSERGGGLLVLGGAQSLADGDYAHTPIADVVPVFLDGPTRRAAEGRFRLELTRDGWLQPWVRLRGNEPAERGRLEAMPEFRTLNHVGRPKPGAIGMANVRGASGEVEPALVVQNYGRGRSAVLTIGDVWRWHLRREEGTDDPQKAWRQMLRWLVADVPSPVECEVVPDREANGSVRVRVIARDGEFLPRDDATVVVTVTPPHAEGVRGKPIELRAEPSLDVAGTFETTYLPEEAGAYRVEARVLDGEGTAAGSGESGWAYEPDVAEFASVAPNEALLERLATETGGRVLEVGDLDAFARELAFEPVPVTEHWTYPLWHQSWVFLLAIGCFAGEWGLRRWRGLP